MAVQRTQANPNKGTLKAAEMGVTYGGRASGIGGSDGRKQLPPQVKK